MRSRMEQNSFISPRKLSRDLHTLAKPREKRASVHRDHFRDYESFNSSILDNPETQHAQKITYMYEPTRRLDQEVAQERRDMIIHPGKISSDTPDWWKSTFKYFKRGEMPSLNSSTIDPMNSFEREKDYDIFNRKKDSYISIQNSRMESLYNNRSELSSRSSRPDALEKESRVRLRKVPNVTPKIGSVEFRDYSIRKPALKVGSNSYVDTYSVF